MTDQPRRHPWLMILIALVAFATVPFGFIGREPHDVAGIPTWLLWSFGFTVLLSGLTVFALLRYWSDDDGD